jgi:hypothetical protein
MFPLFRRARTASSPLFVLASHARAAALVASTVLNAAPANAFNPPPFPRIAGADIGVSVAPFYNDTTYQSDMARQAITILGDYPNYSPGGETMFDVIQAVKQINPNALVFTYVQEDDVSSATSSWPGGWESTINANKWWLYPKVVNGTPSGNPVGASCQAGETPPCFPTTIDNTRASTGPSGQDAVTWMTNYLVMNIYNGETHQSTSGTFTPNIDGFFMDNMFASATITGDWNRDGTTDPAWGATASAALRGGYTEYVQEVRPLMPGKLQIGNIGDWSWIPNGSGGFTTGGTVPPEYKNLLEGGIMESYIGKSWSVEGQAAGWAGMMDSYHKTMDALLEPKLGILNQSGPAPSAATATDFAAMRYGLASSLMDDGYFSYSDQANPGYTGLPVWFDEFSVNLGAPLTPPQTVAYANGVYRRDFENGIALVNPKGNNNGNPITVSLETSYLKIRGTQDPSVNDGSAVSSVTLQARDGIILLRQPSTTNTFGRTTIASTPSSGLSANFKRGSPFALAQAGVITSLSAYMDGNGGAAGFQNIRLVMYQDNSGVPGTKVVESNSTTIAAGMPAQWINLTTPETPVASGTYWIVIQTGDTQGVARDYGDGSTAWYANADTFSDGASDPFGSGSTGTTTLCVYASYVPGTLKQFGRTTVAASTSSGMSADYKRGTPFTLLESGTLTSFSAYLDGNGGASGSQDVRMDLYQDSGGVPGALVAQSRPVIINAGMTPQWIHFTAAHTTLAAGTYWIVLHTGNVQGVARNYGDGSTSWYAAPDAFWDGASPQFGTGSTGTTTLSVYASYVH